VEENLREMECEQVKEKRGSSQENSEEMEGKTERRPGTKLKIFPGQNDND